jgi:DNA polymerase III subunit delta
MRYEDLENKLKMGVQCVYIINGGESLLTVGALSKIERALNITLPDFNKNVFMDDFARGAGAIVESCQALPFCDAKRLVVVHDYLGKKNESERKIFLKYFEKPNPTTCLVFFSTTKSEFFSSLEGKVENIDCEKPSPIFLNSFVEKKLKQKKIVADRLTISKLIDYCNNSVTRLDTEIDKIGTIIGDGATLSETDVEKFVTKDLEYVIFDLTNAISERNGDKAFALVDAMLKNKEQPSKIISTMQTHFRRLFFIARSGCGTAELSKYLGIKEFAISKYKAQLKNFTQVELKRAFDLCAETEYATKSGEMEAKNAVGFLVASILNG